MSGIPYVILMGKWGLISHHFSSPAVSSLRLLSLIQKKDCITANVTSSYPIYLEFCKLVHYKTQSISFRMPSAASQRNPDLNRCPQYEKLPFHITRSTDIDQTSGIINSMAQKNNQGPNFILSLSLSGLFWNHQAGSKVSTALPGITSNYKYIQRKKRDCLFLCFYLCLRKRFSTSCLVDFPSGLISRIDLILKQGKGRRTCYFIKPSLDHSFKIVTLPNSCLPAFLSEFTKALFSSLALIAVCFALFVHFLYTHTIMSTSLW